MHAYTYIVPAKMARRCRYSLVRRDAGRLTESFLACRMYSVVFGGLRF